MGATAAAGAVKAMGIRVAIGFKVKAAGVVLAGAMSIAPVRTEEAIAANPLPGREPVVPPADRTWVSPGESLRRRDPTGHRDGPGGAADAALNGRRRHSLARR